MRLSDVSPKKFGLQTPSILFLFSTTYVKDQESFRKSITSVLLIPLRFNHLPLQFQRFAASTAIGPIFSLHTPPNYTSAQKRHASRGKGRNMPPKKKEEEKKILLGRPGNSLKSGIVCRIPIVL
jgi:hypothetical protein